MEPRAFEARTRQRRVGWTELFNDLPLTHTRRLVTSAFPGPIWAERTPVRFIHRGAWSDTVEARALGDAGKVSAIKVAEAGGGLEALTETWAQAAVEVAEAVSHRCISTYRSVQVVDGFLSAEREYVEGVDVATAIRTGGPAPGAVAVGIAHAAAGGVAAVHAAGFVAGRVSPSHVLTGRDGRVHVLHAATPEGAGHVSRERAKNVDREVAFASPERFAGAVVTRASDVFSIAAVLHLLAVGRPGIPIEHRLGRVLARRGAVLLRPNTPVTGLPPEITTIVSAALGGNAEHRPSIDELHLALASAAASPHEIAAWTRTVLGAAALGAGT